jgi:hypothetical protein
MGTDEISQKIPVIRARHGGARPRAKAGNPRFTPFILMCLPRQSLVVRHAG